MGNPELFATRLIRMSVGENWEDAVKEWNPSNVFSGEDHCPCGNLIKYLCEITNKINGTKVIIGGDCIEKIRTGYIRLTFDAASRVGKNPKLYLPDNSLEELRRLNIIDQYEFTTYKRIAIHGPQNKGERQFIRRINRYIAKKLG